MADDDESEQENSDSDSDEGTMSKRESQLHPLANAGFFNERVSLMEDDSMFDDMNPHEDQDVTMDGSETDDGMFREKASHRSSDITEMASNQMKDLETMPTESDDEDESLYNPDRIQSRERSESITRDPPGGMKQKSNTSYDEGSDTPDDDTDALDEKLEEIERELYTDSMESFRQSLVEIL